MEKFHKLINDIIPIWAWIFLVSVFSGALYAAQLIGFNILNDTLLNPMTSRSLHITLMLYGPVMLALSLLPFALFFKDGLNLDDAVIPMRNYFFLWHLFLFMAVVSIVLGAQRGLPFYDFAYELNFLLAGSGIFYIIAIFKIIKQYEVTPLWVRISKATLFSAPIALLILMNPDIGQVEKTLIGPHGDNTLGMSFTLIPLFYLLIKLHSKEKFIPAWHIFWILPLAVYFLSVAIRIFRGDLSYDEEWVAQWMTFAYAPLLIKWCKDAKLSLKSTPYLVISIWAFLFVMVQGNILFFPDIREAFHKNDLVIAHAHVAMALGILFMALSAVSYFYKLPQKFIYFWLLVVGLIFAPLTFAGFVEAGYFELDITPYWTVRFIAGALAVIGLFYYIFKAMKVPKLKLINIYNLSGFISDGLGAVVLFLFAPILFGFLGLEFIDSYYLVFGFMGFVGILHLIGVYKESHNMAYLTSIARLITGTVFLSLFYIAKIDLLGLLVGFYDISYALLYLTIKDKYL